MYVDCNSCPGRRTACDGCMMNLLFPAPISANVDNDPVSAATPIPSPAEREIRAAVDVLRAAAMVSSVTARSAIDDITAGKAANLGDGRHVLRAG
ncbi:hypothetical protein GCM10009624_32960 [Gordonia sinesedis]